MKHTNYGYLLDMLGKLHKWILIIFLNYFFVNLIDFVYLIQIMFLEYLYSVVVLTSNINRSDVATATHT